MKILSVFGTRPEAIKMAPVIEAIARTPGMQGVVCVTAQHRQMLDQVLALFSLSVHHDLDLMHPAQSLSQLASRILLGVEKVLAAETPDLVLVHGDTTTSFATALAAFHAGIAVGHVEAGLRTRDLDRPFPEEGNRQLTGRLARFHFAPTPQARENLLAEAIPPERIHVTGNTVIDALLKVHAGLPRERTERSLLLGAELAPVLASDRPLLLVTGHRRENFGDGLTRVCLALKELARSRPELIILYPVHLNPQVLGPVRDLLGGIGNIHLTAPVDYRQIVTLIDRAHLVLTDSGGIQEEAPALGKPVLVMREVTERPEALAAGTVRLVGTDARRIVAEVGRLFDDPDHYRGMATARNPYGDGRAGERIAAILRGS
ncbi:MAG: UDP-N-acetylglucosamine 2-epimerase (non-hydrolyzing) [Magnetococcales bacterium]|nr:UDP-N-acetylglucosamine 2-epimerase (non-hydrolyzing) [Magnetococcales bacterium]